MLKKNPAIVVLAIVCFGLLGVIIYCLAVFDDVVAVRVDRAVNEYIHFLDDRIKKKVEGHLALSDEKQDQDQIQKEKILTVVSENAGQVIKALEEYQQQQASMRYENQYKKTLENPLQLDLSRTMTYGAEDPAYRIVAYLSFSCPYCRDLFEALDYIRSNWQDTQVALKFQPQSEIGIQQALYYVAVTRSANQKKSWAFLQYLFDSQDELQQSKKFNATINQYLEEHFDIDDIRKQVLATETQDIVYSDQQEIMSELKLDAVPRIVLNGAKLPPGELNIDQIKHYKTQVEPLTLAATSEKELAKENDNDKENQKPETDTKIK